MQYYYHAFGLNFTSDFECPDLIAQAPCDSPDFTVVFGDIPLESSEHGWVDALTPNRFLICVKGVAKYLIEAGNKITIELAEDANLDSVRLFMFGSAFGALLHQREYAVLHGCTIVHENVCHCFVGPSGIGKSTLAGAFAQQGFRIVSDDVCVIKMNEDGVPMVYPGYPQIKLWEASADKLEQATDNLRRVQPQNNKYFVPLVTDWSMAPCLLDSVTLLKRHDEEGFVRETLSGVAKYKTILGNVYRPHFVNKMQRLPKQLKTVEALLHHISVHCISRSAQGFFIHELVDFIKDNYFHKEKIVCLP